MFFNRNKTGRVKRSRSSTTSPASSRRLPHTTYYILLTLFLLFLLPTTYYLLHTDAQAQTFQGPSSAAGVGTGAIGINASNNISIGTSTPIADTKFFLVASSSASTGFAMMVVQPVSTTTNDSSYTPLRPLFVIRNDAKIGIGGPIAASPSSNVVIHGPEVRVLGTLTADAFSGPLSGTLSAANITAGTFGANTNFGNFTFGTSTNPILHIDNTNSRVGIGTTNPQNTLHVNGVSRFQNYLVGHDGTAQRFRLGWGTQIYTGIGANDLGFGSEAAAKLHLGTGGDAVRMTIDTAGNVGIGTTSPGARLDVKSSAISSVVQNWIASDGSNLALLYETAVGDVLFRTLNAAGTIKNEINSNGDSYFNAGNIGIGTANPDNLLTLYKATDASAARDFLYFRNGTYSTASLGFQGYNFYLSKTANSADGLVFNVSTGYVGIATTTPAYPLTVAGVIYSSTGGFRFPDGTTQTSAASGGLGGGGTVNYVGKFTGTGTIGNSQIFDNGTNIGIGTAAPGYKLDVVGTAKASTGFTVGTSGTYKVVTNVDATLGYLIRSGSWKGNTENSLALAAESGFGISMFTGGSATERLVIDTSGNVGIGTAGPGVKLDVVGAVRNSAPSQGNLELSGLLPGYADNTYPTVKTSGSTMYFSVGAGYTGYIQAAGSYFKGFYDYDNAAYYVDPASNSVMNTINSGTPITSANIGSQTVAGVPWSGVTSKPTAITRVQDLTGSYGSINIAGTTNGYAGINFVDEGSTLMVDLTGATGMYRNTGSWQWYFDTNGVLTAGTVPWGRVTGAPAFITDGNTGWDNSYGYIANGGTWTSGPYTNDWFRANGNTGLYFQSWGGGWYMIDATYIRNYGSKVVYLDNVIYATAFYYTSDERLKTDVGPIGGLDIVTKLNGVKFKWKKDGEPGMGLIAQDVEKVLPEAVTTDTDGLKLINSNVLIAPVVEAIKELNDKVDTQAARIDELENELQLLKGQ